MEQRVLIVNADDFGRSPGVNRGVATAHEDGVVTSASLMVRRAAAVDAADYARRHPKLSVGLHVDLGEWVYRAGAWQAVDESRDSSVGELRRQLELFWLLMGRQPTHVDSHQHVHNHEPFASVIASFARD